MENTFKINQKAEVHSKKAHKALTHAHMQNVMTTNDLHITAGITSSTSKLRSDFTYSSSLKKTHIIIHIIHININLIFKYGPFL